MVKGGSKKKARSQPSGEVSATSSNATLAKPPVAARKSDLAGGKKTVHAKPAAATHALAADSEKEKTRWTEADDTRMLQVFLAEKSEGNQSESGWKAGVYKHVADELNLKVSGGGLKDPASVRNRFSRLKDTYKTIAALREVSGFTWDPEHGCVGVNNNIWQKYVKAHPKAAPFRSKGWPHYDDMDTLCRAVIACRHLAFCATLESSTGAQEGGKRKTEWEEMIKRMMLWRQRMRSPSHGHRALVPTETWPLALMTTVLASVTYGTNLMIPPFHRPPQRLNPNGKPPLPIL
ncbi:hypothetical protein BS47DRAFT_1315862 [Hydnum rufescens UP504]|uniref:Myb/SANT-like domain-containing protein n=1 Tax=Hydnum rufescens UP504 TaxID=1448309 RepID=A0A9P6B1J9_9AGAM|nr:hypothetical protein BS47DRAFT_1315862 [Hydnum rufescens UP504]